MMEEKILAILNEAEQTLQSFRDDQNNRSSIAKAAHLMIESLQNGGKIISAGNGGSMSDAMHFAEELTGRFKDNRKALPAIAISDPTHITCVGNDYGFEFIFSRYVEAHGKSGDVFLAISTSGNSENVIKAAKMALQQGLHVVALTGKDGGKLSEIATVNIQAPYSPYSDRAQEIHIKVIHILIELIESALV